MIFQRRISRSRIRSAQAHRRSPFWSKPIAPSLKIAAFWAGRTRSMQKTAGNTIRTVISKAASILSLARLRPYSTIARYTAKPTVICRSDAFCGGRTGRFCFHKCRLTATGTKDGVYLGRPWRDYGRTVFLDTDMGSHIRPDGWNHWLPEREKTAYMAEYKSTGKGADAAARVEWSHQLTDAEAQQFCHRKFSQRQRRLGSERMQKTNGSRRHRPTGNWYRGTRR